MLCINDISFLNELFVILLQFSNIFVILYIILKILVSEISKYSDAESENRYENHENKLFWKIICEEEAYSAIQTPCGFLKKNAIELPTKPLIWSSEYKHTPCNMKISNKIGHVLLEAQYYGLQPHLSGGPLDGTKDIDRIVLDNTGKSPAVIINYVYMCSEEENFAMQQMISRFSMIEEYVSSCYLNPFPLNWILPKFTEYYYIQESQSYLPFAHNVQWILSPVHQTMSKQQMNTFTKILIPNYAIKINKNMKHFDKNEIFFCSEIEEEAK
ncbi:hypothetical protein CBL_04928 [Carabus blaptoides fortunei]